MSSAPSGSRRQSARLQDKEENVSNPSNMVANAAPTTTIPPTKVQLSTTKARKRKNNYDEDDDGFAFARVKKQKQNAQLPTEVSTLPLQQPPTPMKAVKATPRKSPLSTFALPAIPTVHRTTQNVPLQDENGTGQPTKKKRKRMSFSTPAPKSKQPVRRSKRLSSENPGTDGSPLTKPAEALKSNKMRKEKVPTSTSPVIDSAQEPTSHGEDYSSTKIALPFADTPVISRNKAMREGKAGKGDRRSSLGLRGRRASSLIDSGTSNGKWKQSRCAWADTDT